MGNPRERPEFLGLAHDGCVRTSLVDVMAFKMSKRTLQQGICDFKIHSGFFKGKALSGRYDYQFKPRRL